MFELSVLRLSLYVYICNYLQSCDYEWSNRKHSYEVMYDWCIYISYIMAVVFISSPGQKVHVNYCHHLASVVCKLFTFQASSPKPLSQLEPNLAGMFLGWSSTKLLFFVPVGYSTLLPGPIICSDWLKFQRSSSLKLMNWLNPNCK
jgi:hypothetical protein